MIYLYRNYQNILGTRIENKIFSKQRLGFIFINESGLDEESISYFLKKNFQPADEDVMAAEAKRWSTKKATGSNCGGLCAFGL